MNKNLAIVALSAISALSAGTVFGFGQGPVNIQGIARPSEMMMIEEGSPFTVPTGKRFVATGMATSGVFSSAFNADLTINGLIVATTTSQEPVELPVGITAGPGIIVDVRNNSGLLNPARAFGYLVND